MAKSTTQARPARSRETRTVELDEELRFQRRDWIGQRVGWIVMAAIIATALTGVLGRGGPLSHATTGAAGVLEVEYPRFARHGGSDQLRVRAGERVLGRTELHLAVSSEYLRGFEVRRITPEPERVIGHAEALVFVFPRAPAARELEVSFELQPGPTGRHAGALRAGSEHAVRLNTFTWP